MILLVEDDINLNEINRRTLEKSGYFVSIALTLAKARELLERQIPDLVLLDVRLPDGNGFDFCRELRENPQCAAVPVLFLTAVIDDVGELEGLRCGGNDYLRKPYGIELLRIRVENMLKLRENQAQQEIIRGPFMLNFISNRAYLHGQDMLLTPKEFSLLLIFLKNEDRVMDAQHIYETVWDLSMKNDNQAVKKQISSLRKKLEQGKSGYTINPVYGKGYIFQASL